ncbi:MAG: cysteine desulfurase [Dehalococcoidia bacterium]|nr:cysteine desulfurase [Dehalococcoidia bacterium]
MSMLDVEAIRKDFPILSRQVYGKPLVYLDNAATSQKPRCVIQALVEYYEGYNSNIHRGVHALSMEATERYEAARQKCADFIGSPSTDGVILVRNTTEAINLVARTWARSNIGPGDEILLTEMEHHSNLVPWQQVAQEQGAVLRFIPLTPEQTLDLSDMDRLLNSRTRLVALTHVSNALGTINPVKELGRAAHRVGARILVDGAQSVPHLKVDVQDMGCDFLAFSGHKMLGPTGIGVLYVKQEVVERMEPFLRGGDMVREVWYDKATWNDLPMRFEAGTPNIADTIALGAAIDYLQSLGMEVVREHEIAITQHALDAFQELERVQVFGPGDVAQRGGIISFFCSDVHPHDLGTVLDREGIAIRAGHHCAMPLMRKLGVPATARASFYVYNTEEEVDILVDALKRALRYFARTPNGTRGG